LFRIRWKSQASKKGSPKNTERQNPGDGNMPGQNNRRNTGEEEALPKISSSVTRSEWKNLSLTCSLTENLKMFKAIFINCSDIVFHELSFAYNEDIRLGVVYTEGLVDKRSLEESIIGPLSFPAPQTLSGRRIPKKEALEYIKNHCIGVSEVEESGRVQDMVQAVLSGSTALLVDGFSKALIIDIRFFFARPVSESTTDRLVRGPRDGFVETLNTNTSLLRQRIKNPALKFEMLTVGRVTNTSIAVAYIEGIANPKIVAEVKNRIGRVDVDSVLEGGYIEELIEDNPLSPFCTINHSDRVDKIAAQLLEGRVGIIVDGTPFIMTVPALFIEMIHNPEDYYQRSYISSLIRILRVFSFFLSLTASSLFVALTTYHPELLPTPLLLSIAAQRETVPFPSIIEVLLMEITFEILREAGLRMPMPLGQAVSVVGAIVLGDAAVRAGLVTSVTVIIIAISAIASFAFCYTGTLTARIMRFPLLLTSAFLGLPGLIFGLMFILIHLANLRSFGVPYLYPLAPLSPEELKDTYIRAPWWLMGKRPHLITANTRRQVSGQRPKPDQGSHPGEV